MKVLQPPPKTTPTEWATQNRFLSSSNSAISGRWSFEQTPYVKEILDTVADDTIEEVVFMAAAQVGKSVSLLQNLLGYWVCCDAGPIMYLLPTDSLATDISKDQISPMIEDSPALKERFFPEIKHKTESTIRAKRFKGGNLYFGSFANPRTVSSKPIRYLLIDEIDRNPDATAGKEGDSITLAHRRLATYSGQSKIVICSTPTVRNESRIESLYEQTDKRKYFVPCPHCKGEQLLVFGNLHWDKSETGEPLTETTYFECIHCKGKIIERHKRQMLLNGVWKAEEPTKNKAGFWINGFYSPFVTWQSLVSEWLEVNASQDKERLKAFVNTVFAETWQDSGEIVEENELMQRAEDFELPEQALFLVASVDVQQDFLSVAVSGVGDKNEFWHIERRLIFGNTLLPQVWNDLATFLWAGYGPDKKTPAITVIDSGYNTEKVKQFCKTYGNRRVFAVKGMAGKRQIISRPKHGTGAGVILVGVDEIKEKLYNALKLENAGPEFHHFSLSLDESCYAELCSEERCIKYQNGFSIRYWKKRSKSQPNEYLDNVVYLYAAIQLLNPHWEKMKANSVKQIETKEAEPKAENKNVSDMRNIRNKLIGSGRNNWINKGGGSWLGR